MLFRYGKPNRSGDDCHWRDGLYTHRSREEGAHRTIEGHRGSTRVSHKAGGVQGECGQEPLLWLSWERTGKGWFAQEIRPECRAPVCRRQLGSEFPLVWFVCDRYICTWELLSQELATQPGEGQFLQGLDPRCQIIKYRKQKMWFLQQCRVLLPGVFIYQPASVTDCGCSRAR